MAKYVPNPRDWVREQVELYENSGGTQGTTLRDTGLPVVLVTHWGINRLLGLRAPTNELAHRVAPKSQKRNRATCPRPSCL